MADKSELFEANIQDVEQRFRDSKGGNFVLKDEQKASIKHLFLGKDLIAILPTGFGKSVIFQSLVLIAKACQGDGFVLFVTALKSIIADQISEARLLGMSACDLGDTPIQEVMSGSFEIVFASAEMATSKPFLQTLKKSGRFRNNLAALVVDESHTIDTWTGLR